MLRKRLTLAVVGLCAVWLNASPFTVDGLNYETHKGAPYTTFNTVALTGATSRSIESLTVPATVTYNGVEYYVDYIHPDAFDNYSNLRSVRFEDSPHIIQSIGRLQEPVWLWPTSPFQNCPIEEYYIGRDIIYKSNEMDQLVLESTAESVSITFAGEITYLSSLPFYYIYTNTTSQILPRLTSLSIGGTISEIKSGTFADAINLKNLTILPGNAIDLRTEMFAEGQVFDHVTLEGSQYGSLSNIAYTGVTLSGAYLTVPMGMFYGNKFITNVILSEGVAKIGNSAFMGCDNLTSITFPSTLEEIDSYAFNGCKQLQNVTFNEGLKKIGVESFQACEGFDRLVIPGSVEEISDKAFFGAWNVNEILIEHAADGSALKMGTSALGVHEVETLTLNRVVEYDINSTFVYLNDMTPKHLIFGEGWETIPHSIRKNDKYLQSVTLPSTVRRIGRYAFMGCDNLTSINFPSTLEEIDDYAFNGCTQLQNVTFSEGLKKIGVESFQACEGFDRLVIPGSVEEISSKAFFGAWNVNEILIEPAADGSVLKMGNSALGVHEVETLTLNRVVECILGWNSVVYLNDMTSKHLVFGEGWETIPGQIRENDKYLQSVTLPSTVRKIGNAAFRGCDSLTSINFPPTLEEIDDYAFNGCTQLQNVTFSEGLKKIGVESFQACEGFDRLVIPGSVEEISSKAFFGAWNVNEILIEPAADGSVLKMGDSALGVHEVETMTLNRVVSQFDAFGPYYAKHLNDCNPKHLVFGEGWKTIPETMMARHDSLMSVTLPASLTRINILAFSECPQLEAVTVQASLPPECGAENVFASQIFPVATLYVPNGSRNLYEEAFVWRNFSNISVIGNPVVSVNFNAEGGTVVINGTTDDTIEVTQGDKVEVVISPEEGYKLASLTINGKDAIELLTDGILIIDSVDDSMNIEVMFGLSSGVGELTQEACAISSRPGVIAIGGMIKGAAWQLYDIAGTLIYSGNDAEVAVAPGIYVVRIAGRSHRVMVR
ncbi:MAG: leucine-rich repeat domain-containing protein [Muribaculaceae bacterium]|nr:leucine-rich repeat domain-containing protein [Muribaculaceae bacterium]